MSFKKKKYEVIKQAISPELAQFCYNYILLKRDVADTMFKNKYISPFEEAFGVWEKTTQQVPNTYAHYADIAMETLLLKLHPLMEKKTGMNLFENYSYVRLYKKGDILKRHKDRFSCEISTTLNLGGDPWPIYLEPSGRHGLKGIKINLKPGDMLIYRGEDLEHWREPFTGEKCAQVFLHYNSEDTKGAEHNLYDTRPHPGLPAWFKRKSYC
jgi:hypothetical protein|tara:strand:+ start:798 stop:1433 length:636 start_codon:yes stop_codon:yes gene_type:complete